MDLVFGEEVAGLPNRVVGQGKSLGQRRKRMRTTKTQKRFGEPVVLDFYRGERKNSLQAHKAHYLQWDRFRGRGKEKWQSALPHEGSYATGVASWAPHPEKESTWKSKFFLLSRRSASRYRALLEHVYHKQRSDLQVGCLNFPHWFRSVEEGHQLYPPNSSIGLIPGGALWLSR
jgi:hypothetical protein